MSKNYKSNPEILNEARDYINGLMLGDGSVHSVNSGRTNHYRQICKYKEWLDKIDNDLYRYGVECRVDNGRLYTGGFSAEGGSILYNLDTRCYVEFKEMDNLWYKPWYDIDNYNKHYWHKDKGGEYFIRKKIIPKDICLTSECVANWYLSDGSCPKPSYCKIIISTDGFLREDTIFVSELLSDVLDIKSTVDKDGKIYIGIKSDISTFLNYMKDCEIPGCYSYKFPEEAMR